MLIFCVMLVCWQPDMKGIGRLGNCVGWHWGRKKANGYPPSLRKQIFDFFYTVHYALWLALTLKTHLCHYFSSAKPSVMCSGLCAKAIQIELSCKIWIQIQVLWVTVWTFGSALCFSFSKMYLPGVEMVRHIHLQAHLTYISKCATLT